MKIIEGMKQIKDLQVKAKDISDKVSMFCADTDIEAPTYKSVEEQTTQIATWVQGHGDILKEILKLREAIQRTNLATQVTIELDGKQVTKSIAAWIHRRRDLAIADRDLFIRATQRAKAIPSGNLRTTTGEVREVKLRRYYDQAEFDERAEVYRAEPGKIDGVLEVVNAVTDLIEA